MLNELLEKIGKNKLFQAVTVASVLGSSTAALAKPKSYLIKPETNYSLEVYSEKLEHNLEIPELKLDSFLLANSERPPYLPPKETEPKKSPEKKGPCPPYLCPEQYGEPSSPSQGYPPYSEKAKKSSDYVWGGISSGLGVLLILAAVPNLEGEVCSGSYPSDYECETGPDPLGYTVLIAGVGLTSLGLYYLFRK